MTGGAIWISAAMLLAASGVVAPGSFGAARGEPREGAVLLRPAAPAERSARGHAAAGYASPRAPGSPQAASAPAQARQPAAGGNMSAQPPVVPGAQASSLASVPASDPRVQKLGRQLMCMCGCNQILIECTHAGSNDCAMHDSEMAELAQRVARGESNSLILQSFVQEYGPQVLVVPPAHGFDLTAWLMPIFASLIGLSLAIVVVQRWRERGRRHAVAAPAAGLPGARPRPDLVARARRDTEGEDY